MILNQQVNNEGKAINNLLLILKIPSKLRLFSRRSNQRSSSQSWDLEYFLTGPIEYNFFEGGQRIGPHFCLKIVTREYLPQS